MGTTKNEVFNEDINELSSLFKALGNPARIAIIQYLRNQEKCICTDLVKELPLAQATISQHLKELKNAGIIQGSVSGTSICYCLNLSKIAIIERFLSQLNYDQNSTCC
ncbi:MAG: ArsR/SmtB family transcription factor [Flavobacteriales bacterium]